MITGLDRNTALILIDLQNSIVSAKLARPIEDIITHVNALIAAFRKKALPIVAVNVNPAGAAWTRSRKEAKPMRVPEGEDWCRISEKVDVGEHDIFITKHSWSAFFETALHDELQRRHITGVVMAGISTSIGVEGTARAASELGYNISFAVDAMTDMHAAAHDRSIDFIFPRMGERGTSADIIETLNKL